MLVFWSYHVQSFFHSLLRCHAVYGISPFPSHRELWLGQQAPLTGAVLFHPAWMLPAFPSCFSKGSKPHKLLLWNAGGGTGICLRAALASLWTFQENEGHQSLVSPCQLASPAMLSETSEGLLCLCLDWYQHPLTPPSSLQLGRERKGVRRCFKTWRGRKKKKKAIINPALVFFFFLIEMAWREHFLGSCPCLKENANYKKMWCLRSCSALLCATKHAKCLFLFILQQILW